MNHIPPKFNLTAFNCTICGAYAQQDYMGVQEILTGKFGGTIPSTSVSYCHHCKKYSIWHKGSLIYPSSGNSPLPNIDMPEDVKADYEEARSIAGLSPRGAAALLRLSIQKLCKHLGEKGENINNDIKSLVKKGLPEKLQKALDSVRVIGNNAVHPGVIDLKDDFDTAQQLFVLINIICENQISQPKAIDEFYETKIPESDKNNIKKRDNP